MRYSKNLEIFYPETRVIHKGLYYLRILVSVIKPLIVVNTFIGERFEFKMACALNAKISDIEVNSIQRLH